MECRIPSFEKFGEWLALSCLDGMSPKRQTLYSYCCTLAYGLSSARDVLEYQAVAQSVLDVARRRHGEGFVERLKAEFEGFDFDCLKAEAQREVGS